MKTFSKHIQIWLISTFLILLTALVNPNFCQGRFSLEVLPGGAAIIPSSLFISQEGFPDLKFTARYQTESFILPIYYSYRIGYRINRKSIIELELNHLKVLLDNNPPEIKEFSVTHGFNQLWANHSFVHKGFVFRTGLGAVIAHPESIVREKRFDMHQGFANMGYYISGITSQLSVQKKIFWGKHLFFSAETKLNAAYAKIKIADGFATLPIYAWHGMIGLGISF